jgi:hypothetical protein
MLEFTRDPHLSAMSPRERLMEEVGLVFSGEGTRSTRSEKC